MQATGDSGLDIPWAEADAIIFVVDAQDDYFDALSKLNQVILQGYRSNPDIHFHVFINKVDGLSDDYKYDTQRDIEQRVHEELIDSSHEFQDPASTEPFRLEAEVKLRFHLTSVFESSIFVAFSRIQQRLMQEERKTAAAAEEPESGQDDQDKPSEKRISLHDAVEQACNLLCSSCSLEKAYIFDVPSRTFVGCDTSPFDLPLFDVMFQYTKFLTEFSDLYMAVTADTSKSTRTWSASVVRLGSDTSVAFWQLNKYDFNIARFRTTIDQLERLAAP
ncbi:GTP-binding protein gtr2 [Malassezia brasiliensis]|uniref:GTP-binding protein n=1 Tax=Malassezia brasiliensis TaxID=1821822 RepID=A0AAF0DRJ7_9BASI|nr:GTP-binding protein gtr2 [Malassezia brasiliensis]